MADPQIQQLDQLSGDPSLTAYVDETTGAVSFRSTTNDAATLAQRADGGLRQATAEDIERRKRYLENTTAAAQAASAAKLATNVATFGLTHTQGDTERIGDFKDKSPTLAMLSEMAGSVAPGIAGGAVAGAAMRGLGLGQRAAALGAIVGEEVAQSGAIEAENATLEGRDIDVANVISGIPLAMGMSAAARVARSGKTFASHAAAKLARSADDLPDVAREANAISKGAATSRARKSVGAAGAADEGYVPLTNEDVRYRAENHEQLAAETDKLGGDALDALEGGETPGFDAVHNIGLKEGDIAGKMGDADAGRMLDAADTHMQSLDELATDLEKRGQLGAARKLRDKANGIAESYTLVETQPEKLVIAVDQSKRELQRLQKKYRVMARSDSSAEGIVQALDEVEAPMRANLEDPKTWGRDWADKQTIENAEWQEVIRHGAAWQGEYMQRAHGAAGKTWRGDREVPVFVSRGDAVEHTLGMTKKKMKETLGSMRKYADAVDRMNQVKESIGVASLEHTPITRLKQSVDDIRLLADELEDTWYTWHERGGKDIAAKAANKRTAMGGLEQAFEVAKEIPGVGGTLKAAEKVKEAATGKGFFEVPVVPARPDLTTEAARSAVGARRRVPGKPYTPPSDGGGAIPPPGPRGVDAPEAGPSEAYQRARAIIDQRRSGAGSVDLGGDRPIQQVLKERHPDLKMFVSEGPGRITLSKVVVPEHMRGSGAGSKFMQDLLAIADARGARIELTPSADFGGSVPRLKQFYKRFGFVENKGKFKDYEISESMYRPPSKAKARGGERGFADAGAGLSLRGIATSPMAMAAGLGVAALAVHPVTQLLKNMNDDQKAVRERAALGLVAPATRPPALPSTIARFREGQRTLAESFELRKDDLITALSNPESLLAGLDDAFGDLGDSHPEMYGALVARAHAAAQYVMAEAPPSVAIGLTRPDGIPPDALSMAKFADIWSGAFNPGDVIYDVGTGSATPTQVKALKDVHPDVFDALRLDVLKAVGDAGGKVPFETLRKLDVLFDVPGIAPPSFQPQMSQTMQQAWAEPSGGNRSKAALAPAPDSPTSKFGAGPSTMK